MEHNEWKIVFSASFFHNNKVFLTLDYCSLTLGNYILTLEKLGPKVNDSWGIVRTLKSRLKPINFNRTN